MEEDIKRVETLTPEQAGKIIGKNPEYIRALLRQGKVNWGTAVESKRGRWNYNIIRSKFLKYDIFRISRNKQKTNIKRTIR